MMNRRQRRIEASKERKAAPAPAHASALERANARLRAEVTHLYDATDAQIERHPHPDISCKKGCAGCCRQVVLGDSVEGERIVERNPEAVARAMPKLLEHMERFGDAFTMRDIQALFAGGIEGRDSMAARYFDLNMPCAFLDEHNLCTIYEDRPLACRTHFVLSDPAQCSSEQDRTVTILDRGGTRIGAQEHLLRMVIEARGGISLGVLPALVLGALGHESIGQVRVIGE